MINAESKKATGQVTHLNSTPFLPVSIVLHYQAKPHSPEINYPPPTTARRISALPLTLQRHFSTPAPRHQPHHSSLLHEKFPPPQTCIFPTLCSCPSPGFSYSGNSPLSLIHHLATSPSLHLLQSETFPFVLPNLHIIPIFLSATFFSSKPPYPHGISHCPFMSEGGLPLPASPSVVIL